MSLWGEARVAVYGRLRAWLPPKVRDWIGGSRLTEPLRRSVLWPSGARNLVETAVDFQGHRFQFAASVKVVDSVRRNGGIENGLCRLILKECTVGGCALDVGANYGFVSLVMAQAVGAGGQVHSFEADPLIFEAVSQNIARNELQRSCSVVNRFVGDKSDGGRFVRIDDYVAQRGLSRVDFIKIDVDGPDLQVLEGARATLQRFHPIVVIEMTKDEQAIVDLLRSYGYECSDLHGNEVTAARWPANVFAAVGRRLAVPARS